MSYTKNIYRYLNATEFEEYHSGKYGAPGQERGKKKKPTPEQMERVNQWNREKLCRRKMRRWFRKKDMFATLTYAVKNRPPDMVTAKEHFKKFTDQVRKEYKKRGYVLRWIRNIEVGTRNAWHIHILLNRIPDTDLIIADAWPFGTVDMAPCHKKGEFRELAAYMTKTPKTEPRLKESSYSTSRNLPLLSPVTKVITRWDTWDKIRIPKGFYLDPDSYYEGINPVTGFPFRGYTLFRLDEKEEPPDEAGRRICDRQHKRTGKRDRKGHVYHADTEEKRR